MTSYTFELKSYECNWTQHYMVMFVRGVQVGWATVTNLHETFEERCSQVRRQLINEYENAQCLARTQAAR